MVRLLGRWKERGPQKVKRAASIFICCSSALTPTEGRQPFIMTPDISCVGALFLSIKQDIYLSRIELEQQ